jgi:2-phosphosulfolactate phosphatase
MEGFMAYLRQEGLEVRCEWGLHGVEVLREDSDVIIIVDVLSFSTCVDIAVSRGAVVFPYRWQDDSARSYAESVGALLASPRRSETGFTLAPSSLVNIPAGTRIVLPSPNGSTLSLATEGKPTIAGCLRNARAVASAAATFGRRITVVPAGERWADGSLRPAVEDLLGAGAIVSSLPGRFSVSPEADVARAAFLSASADLHGFLCKCVSGQELIERNFERDVKLASELNCSDFVPILTDGGYTRWQPDLEVS